MIRCYPFRGVCPSHLKKKKKKSSREGELEPLLILKREISINYELVGVVVLKTDFELETSYSIGKVKVLVN